jgi:uncharacterized protein (TIGR03067 family)
MMALSLVIVLITSNLVSRAEDVDDLQGVWLAQSLEAGGKPAPADAVKRMQFTFRGDKLLIRGNFRDDREEECSYKIDPKQSPKHLDFKTPTADRPVVGIYQLSGDELKVCLRHASGSEARPTEFATMPEASFVLIVFKRQKP